MLNNSTRERFDKGKAQVQVQVQVQVQDQVPAPFLKRDESALQVAIDAASASLSRKDIGVAAQLVVDNEAALRTLLSSNALDAELATRTLALIEGVCSESVNVVVDARALVSGKWSLEALPLDDERRVRLMTLAIDIYARVSPESPRRGAATLQLAGFARDAGDLAAAEQHCRDAIVLLGRRPEDTLLRARAYEKLAASLLEQRRDNEAFVEWDRAFELAAAHPLPDSAEAQRIITRYGRYFERKTDDESRRRAQRVVAPR